MQQQENSEAGVLFRYICARSTRHANKCRFDVNIGLDMCDSAFWKVRITNTITWEHNLDNSERICLLKQLRFVKVYVRLIITDSTYGSPSHTARLRSRALAYACVAAHCALLVRTVVLPCCST